MMSLVPGPFEAIKLDLLDCSRFRCILLIEELNSRLEI